MICDCPEHRHVAPTELDGHTFRRETAGMGSDPDDKVVFRWACSCEIVGRWQHRRSEAYHLWLKHVQRRGPA